MRKKKFLFMFAALLMIAQGAWATTVTWEGSTVNSLNVVSSDLASSDWGSTVTSRTIDGITVSAASSLSYLA